MGTVGPIDVGIFVGATDEVKSVGSSVVRLEDVLSVGGIGVNVVSNAISDTILVGEDVSGSGGVVGGIVGCKVSGFVGLSGGP